MFIVVICYANLTIVLIYFFYIYLDYFYRKS